MEEFGAQHALGLSAAATVFEQLQQVVEQGMAHFGRLNVVFANTGTGIFQPGTENGDPDDWENVIDINVNALLWTAKLTLPYLRA